MATGKQKELHFRLDTAKKALQDQLAAANKAGVGQKELTKTWETGKNKLFDEFVQMGLSKKEAQKLADKYAGIKPKVETKVTQPGMSDAQRKAKDLLTRYNSFRDKDITLGLKLSSNYKKVKADFDLKFPQSRATGGPIQNVSGHGKQGVDTELVFAAAGEHMLTQNEVKAAGGHEAVYRIRKGMLAGDFRGYNQGGEIKGYAAGGAITRKLKMRTEARGAAQIADPAEWARQAGSVLAKAAAKQFQSQINTYGKKAEASAGGGNFGRIDVSNPRGRTSFKGHTFTNLFAASLRAAEKDAGRSFSIYQGGFRPRTSYSGTSHQGDAIDARVNSALLRASRKHGIAMWDRTGKGNWAPHMHGVPLPGAGYGAGSAIWQAQDYKRGGDGLKLGGIVKGNRGGITTRVGEGRFDELVTPLPRGLDLSKQNLQLALSGVKAPQRATFEPAAGSSGGKSGNTFNFGDSHGLDARDIAREVVTQIAQQEALHPSW